MFKYIYIYNTFSKLLYIYVLIKTTIDIKYLGQSLKKKI